MKDNTNHQKSEEYYNSILDHAEELIEKGLESVYKKRGRNFIPPGHGNDDRKRYSYITLDLELLKYSSDWSDVIAYQDAKTMQKALLDWIEQMVTPEMLEMVRNGEIENLTLRLGPRTLSGLDLREAL